VSDLPAVPDYYGQFIAPFQRQQALGIEQQNADSQRMQVNQQATQLALRAAEQVRQAALLKSYQNDAAQVVSNPTPEGYESLMLKYPDQYQGIKAAWDQHGEEQQKRDLGLASNVYAAISSGRVDLALDTATKARDALKAAGEDTSQYDTAIQMLQSGDPAQIQKVKGLAGYIVAAATGPGRISDTLQALSGGGESYTLSPGETRFQGGEMIAQSPFLKIGDGIAERSGTGDASSRPTAAVASTGGAKAVIAHSLANEGVPGKSYNPKDANGSPTNWGINWKANAPELVKMGFTPATFKDMTRDQAEQLYKDKYWPESGAANLPANLQAPYFDAYIRSPKRAQMWLKQSGNDPAKFMALAGPGFQQMAATRPNLAPYAKAWANRDAGNLAIATGAATSASAASDGAPPPPQGYHWLVPPNAATKNLPSGYEPDPAKPGAIRPIPGGPADSGSDDVLSKYGIAPQETGPSVLAKLPATVASQVKAMADGRIAPPTSTALAKNGAGAKYWNDVLQLTNQYDPGYDASSFPARKAAITAFTGAGKGAMLVGSANRVANHMDLLANESKKLAGPTIGWGEGIGPLNSAAAAFGQLGEPNEVKAYDTEAGFVAGELGKLAKAGVVTEGEVDRIVGNLSRKNSEPTRQAAIKAAVGIIAGAIGPLKDQYNSAFTNGSTRPTIPWVSPKAQEIYKRIAGVDMSLSGDDNNVSANAGAPVRVSSPAEAAKLPSGTLFITPDGRTLRKR
jgi:hypothetical protein